MKREKRYTPGNWGARAHRVLLNDNLIASCWAPRLPDECRHEGESWLDMREMTRTDREAIEAEQQANARLISAAPDMVEALADLVEEVEEVEEYELGNPDTLRRARAALAKALGQGGAS